MKPATLSDLAALVAGAAVEREDAPPALLSALAELDPTAAARWLLQDRDAPLVGGAGSQLAYVVHRIALAVADRPDLLARSETLGLLERFGHLLPPAVATDFATGAGDADEALRTALHRALQPAPAHSGLLRVAAQVAVSLGDAEQAHALLTRLGHAEPSLSTIRFVHGVRARLPKSDRPTVRLALLSSFTIDPLASYLDLECRALDLEPEIQVAPFNSWGREMLGQGSALQQFDPEIAFLSAAADDLIPGLAGTMPLDELRQAGTAAVEHLLSVAGRFSTWSGGTLVVHSLYSAFQDPLGPAAGRDGPSRWEILAELNGRLAAGLRELPRAYLLEVPETLARRRQGAPDNPKMRHLARMRLSEQLLGDVARAYARFIAPLKGRTRKCVVLDLDNTVWGGIVGEDGPDGIRLGDTSPGSEYREFQQYLLGLTQRGFLLAINSKNNEADALEVVRSHDAMVLREDAFSAMRINWDNKPSNMLSLAEELSIGLDSFVFVDDNAKERALMRQMLPQVLTPEMPRDPALYRETLEHLPELQVLTVTEEDGTRTKQYSERRQREQLRVTTESIEEYLQSLSIEVDIGMVSDRTLPRVHQLFQRTNQFNLTTRRYEVGELSARAADPGWRIYTTHVRDRFGDHGLVASALIEIAPTAWAVENFVMSCRVIGYGVEDALLAQIGTDAREAGAQWLVGDFIPSKKNAPARDFYARNAFTRDTDAGEAERWRRDVAAGGIAAPPWTTVRLTHDS